MMGNGIIPNRMAMESRKSTKAWFIRDSSLRVKNQVMVQCNMSMAVDTRGSFLATKSMV